VAVERFWGFLNPRAILPLKLVLINMEATGELDVGNALHIGAIQQLGGRLLQYACDAARHVWNDHPVRERGGGRVLGTPLDLRAAAPQMPRRLALADDVEDEYIAASGNAVDLEPSWARAVDALYGQPHRQELRRTAVGAIMGSDEEAWSDILHMGGGRFRRAFAHWLKFV
jgi:hypothetical protein